MATDLDILSSVMDRLMDKGRSSYGRCRPIKDKETCIILEGLAPYGGLLLAPAEGWWPENWPFGSRFTEMITDGAKRISLIHYKYYETTDKFPITKQNMHYI